MVPELRSCGKPNSPMLDGEVIGGEQVDSTATGKEEKISPREFPFQPAGDALDECISRLTVVRGDDGDGAF